MLEGCREVRCSLVHDRRTGGARVVCGSERSGGGTSITAESSPQDGFVGRRWWWHVVRTGRPGDRREGWWEGFLVGIDERLDRLEF